MKASIAAALPRVRRTTGRILISVVTYALLIGLSFVFLYPFLYMLVTACKSSADLTDIAVKWLPNGIEWANFSLAFSALTYPTRLINTVLVTVLSVLGHLLVCSFVGYGFARFSFRFKGFWTALLILAIVIPTETLIVPIYILFSRIGFLGSYLPIVVPCYLGFGLRGALFIFVFRQLFLSLPKALEEASALDGCGSLRTFFYIALPNARSSTLICCVLGVVWHWNDTFEPSIYLNDPNSFLLPQMLPQLYASIGEAPIGGLAESLPQYNEAVAMAATALVILPLIVFYLLLQSRFMHSVERSGITG